MSIYDSKTDSIICSIICACPPVKSLDWKD